MVPAWIARVRAVGTAMGADRLQSCLTACQAQQKWHPFCTSVARPEVRALRLLKREDGSGTYVFITERGGPMTTDNVRKLLQRRGQEAKLPFPVHPQMVGHACGYKLANDDHDTRAIQHYLGHRNIQ